MKRILITPQVQKIADDYYDEIIAKEKKKTISKLTKRISEIQNSNPLSPNWKLYVKYLKKIIKHYDELIVLHPRFFKYYWMRYFFFLKDTDLDSESWKAGTKQKFYEMVVSAMGYKTVRSEIIAPYIQKLNIRVCVNCNSDYVLSTEKRVRLSTGKYGVEIKGRFQLDHFWAKSKYPFLSISFFNLQPSCGFCNLWKKDKIGKFNLYTDFYQKINPFLFVLDKKALLTYLLNSNSKLLHVELHSNERGLRENHEQIFCIDDIYKLLNDEAEEIIWKAKIYNKSFVGQLQNWFKNKFTKKSEKDLFRFVFGFYPNIDDIHKRPLTKMKQDIAKQLELV